MNPTPETLALANMVPLAPILREFGLSPVDDDHTLRYRNDPAAEGRDHDIIVPGRELWIDAKGWATGRGPIDLFVYLRYGTHPEHTTTDQKAATVAWLNDFHGKLATSPSGAADRLPPGPVSPDERRWPQVTRMHLTSLEALPPAPDDLWSGYRQAAAGLLHVVARGSGSPDLLTQAVARCVAREMQAAGRHAAQAEFLDPSSADHATARVLANLRIESGARLLDVYRGLQSKFRGYSPKAWEPAEEIRDTATLLYREALDDERAIHRQARDIASAPRPDQEFAPPTAAGEFSPSDDSSLPPAPPDLWAEVPRVDPSPSLVLAALARSIHIDMTQAGRWAAHGEEGVSAQCDASAARTLSSQFADQASRALALYEAVRDAERVAWSHEPSAVAVRAAATLTFRKALRHERDALHRPAPAYNDELYQQLQAGPPRPESHGRRL